VRLVRLRPADGDAGDDGEEEAVELAVGNAEDPAGPIREGAGLLLHGEILAVQGLGGFHLACDATVGPGVRRLRERKRRPHKPFAVMFRDVEQVREHCMLGAEEERLLTSPEHPIVLLSRKPAEHGCPLDAGVAPGQRQVGAMLPYTPLHILLLLASGHPLVMTSGNLAEEPIVKDPAQMATLATIADAYLVHDREVAARCDDSVALVRRGGVRLLRRSRGYAPLPEALPRPLPQTLGCGAELKNAFCLTREADAFLAPHIGDLENFETLAHYEASVARYCRLFRVDPEVIGHDLHPEYLATKFALALPHEAKVAVQHHHAHVAARMVEHGREEPVIGVSMDGLGYGHDGRLWGGEFLVCDLLGYRRVAHLEELPLAGGAAAIRQPWRTAAGWSYALLGEDGLTRAIRVLRRRAVGWPAVSGEQLDALRRQIDGAVNAPLTTSCGRLFDALAALAGIRHEVTYEGQAAIELEMQTDPGDCGSAEPYPLMVDQGLEAAASGRRRGASEWAAMDRRVLGSRPAGEAEPAVVRLAPLFDAALTDLEADRSPGFIGARLHAAVATLVAEVCGGIGAATGLRAVVLAGGVFQNRLLADLCEERLQAGGFEVLSDGLVPGNDGGIALGQAAVAGYTVLRQRGLLA
jgi:hydrogenase maturation protein HypF